MFCEYTPTFYYIMINYYNELKLPTKHINYKNGLSIDIPSKDYVISDKDIGMRSSHEHPWVAGSLRRKMSHIKLAFKRK
jgi:hypothetical protein